MNLSELEAEESRLLGDVNNDRWSTSVLTIRNNEAATIVQGYTNAVKTKETLTPSANTEAVTLDADTMDIVKATITRTDGSIYELDGITEENLDFDYPNWRNYSAGAPLRYFYDASGQQLHLVPKPDSANAIASGLIVYEVRKPADLVNASDIPFDSNNQMVPYHMAIVYWVVAQCWMDDGTPEALAKSRFYKSGVLEQKGAGQFEFQIMRILSKFDNPEDVPDHIKYRPTGGRAGAYNYPTHDNPFLGI